MKFSLYASQESWHSSRVDKIWIFWEDDVASSDRGNVHNTLRAEEKKIGESRKSGTRRGYNSKAGSPEHDGMINWPGYSGRCARKFEEVVEPCGSLFKECVMTRGINVSNFVELLSALATDTQAHKKLRRLHKGPTCPDIVKWISVKAATHATWEGVTMHWKFNYSVVYIESGWSL